jgi:type I restriction enzyme S subunit
VKWKTLKLGDLYTTNKETVDPSGYLSETFHLYSVPAYDSKVPVELPGEAIGSVKQVVSPNDVLLCRIVPHIRRAWVVGKNDGHRLIASGEWIVMRHKDVHPEYLRHFLLGNEFHSQFMMSVAGVGGSLLRARPSAAADIEVPFPPIEEQRRIAAILDKADALRQKRRIALQKLDSLIQSHFFNIFGDPVENSFSFPVLPVSSFVARFETGKSIAPDENENAASQFRVLKVSAVTSHDYRPEESKPISEGHLFPDSHFVKSGDLLFSRANTSDLIGATAYVPIAEKNRLLPDKIWRFIWRDAKKIEPLFVWFLFRQPAVRRAIAQLATGTSGSMKNISQGKVLGIRLGVPPLAEQKRFADVVSAWMGSRERMRDSAKMLDQSFSSLQYRAFRSEL